MTPTELLARLNAAGIEVAVQGDRLRYRPLDAVPPDLLAEMRQRKAELLALLATDRPASDPLSAWLDAPAPEHVEPPTAAPTLRDLDALAARLADSLAAGEAAIEGAPPSHPRQSEARRRFDELRARAGALGDLRGALRGEPYDRARLAAWCAGQAFRDGDMAAVLRLVDEAGAATRQDAQDARRLCTGCGTRTLAPWEPSPDGVCAWCTNTARARAGLPPLGAEPDAAGGWTWRPAQPAEDG